MKTQPTPTVTDEDVRRVAIRDFGEANLSFVLSILDEYGKQEWPRGCARVRLAIMKLANGDMDRLLDETQVATVDYRDVISPAEYPTYSWDEKDEVKKQISYKDDWKQYSEWLSKE